MLNYTVDNLIAEVRAQIDEQNVESVDTDRDILPALNRARQHAFDILAREYPDPILKYDDLELVNGTLEYDIPEDAFEDRITHVEIPRDGSENAECVEVTRVSHRSIGRYRRSGAVSHPRYYCIVGRKIRFSHIPTGEFDAVIWYLRNPEKLVQPQGRVVSITGASNYCLVDTTTLGDSLTTESDQLGSYVNWIDGQTGEIRGTLQISAISADTGRITFRSSPIRSTVLNRTVTGDLTTLTTSQDDFLAPVEGTCVPYFGQVNNFLIQFAVAEITRSKGGSADSEEKVLEKFEQQVSRTWVGRESTLRIRKVSDKWTTVRRLR